MKARDIMTTPVVTVPPDASIRDTALLLLERRISGLPVVDRERVVGIVSEGDLLRRHEIGTDRAMPPASWWMRLFRGEPGAADYVKSHAVRVADVMSQPVTSVVEGADLRNIAILLGKRNIKRVPVMRGETLVGIVTRANIVQALAVTMQPPRGPRKRTDENIRRHLLQELGSRGWWRETSNVIVTDGIVHYWGVCDDEHQRQAARVAAESIPGVRGIEDHRMTFAEIPTMS
jgi:CBS domain-containing protein